MVLARTLGLAKTGTSRPGERHGPTNLQHGAHDGRITHAILLVSESCAVGEHETK